MKNLLEFTLKISLALGSLKLSNYQAGRLKSLTSLKCSFSTPYRGGASEASEATLTDRLFKWQLLILCTIDCATSAIFGNRKELCARADGFLLYPSTHPKMLGGFMAMNTVEPLLTDILYNGHLPATDNSNCTNSHNTKEASLQRTPLCSG